MRTNVAGFALALGMGLLVVLMGLLALSAAGLTSFTPPAGGLALVPADSVAASAPKGDVAVATTYKTVLPSSSAAIAAGDALFKNNCIQCHAVSEKIVGPALAGITVRRTVPWVVSWVHSPAKVIASGDEYAVKLYGDYGQQQMPAFPQLSAEDVRSILTWVESEQNNGASVAVGPALAVAQ